MVTYIIFNEIFSTKMSLYGRDSDGFFRQNGVYWNTRDISTIVNRFASKFSFQQKLTASSTASSQNLKVIHLSNSSRVLVNNTTSLLMADNKVRNADDLEIGANLAQFDSTRPRTLKATMSGELATAEFDFNIPLLAMAGLIAEEATTTTKTQLETGINSNIFTQYNRLTSNTVTTPTTASEANLNSVNYDLLTIHRSTNTGVLHNISLTDKRGIDFRRELGTNLYPLTDQAIDSARNYIVAYNIGLRAGSQTEGNLIHQDKVNMNYILPNLKLENQMYTLPEYDLFNGRMSTLTRPPLLSPNEPAVVLIPFLAGLIDSCGSLDDRNFLTLNFTKRYFLQDVVNLITSLGINYTVSPPLTVANQTVVYDVGQNQQRFYSLILDSFGVSRLIALGVQSQLLSQLPDNFITVQAFIDAPISITRIRAAQSFDDVFTLSTNSRADSYYDNIAGRLVMSWQDIYILPTDN